MLLLTVKHLLLQLWFTSLHSYCLSNGLCFLQDLLSACTVLLCKQIILTITEFVMMLQCCAMFHFAWNLWGIISEKKLLTACSCGSIFTDFFISWLLSITSGLHHGKTCQVQIRYAFRLERQSASVAITALHVSIILAAIWSCKAKKKKNDD